MSNNPYSTSPMDYSGGMGGGGNFNAAKAKVATPAIGLVVVGALSILAGLYQIASGLLFVLGIFPTEAMRQAQLEQIRQSGGSTEGFEAIQNITAMISGPIGIILGLVILVVAAVIIMGGMKLKNLESRSMATTAAVLAMIPCLSGCCLLGLPFGIWALVAMNDPNVQASFRK